LKKAALIALPKLRLYQNYAAPYGSGYATHLYAVPLAFVLKTALSVEDSPNWWEQKYRRIKRYRYLNLFQTINA
jgi:hypothetical protein